MIVNKRKLAEIVGCTEETLTQWQKQGMPILLSRLGREGNQYETTAVLSWLEARRQSDAPPTDYDTERTRKVKLEADILALQKAQLEGRLIPADKAEQAWAALVAAFRSRMLSIPSKCAPPIAGLESFIEVERLLSDAIHDALAELADSDLATRVTDQFSDAVECSSTANQADSEPMGESESTSKRRRQRRAGPI